MAIITRTNLAAISAYNGLVSATKLFSESSLRLSTGLRINNPSDDPAGYVFSERMKTNLRSLEQVQRYNQTSRSMVQTASDGISSIIDLLQDMRQLAVASANSTLTTADRTANQTQFSSLRDQIDSVANNTFFNAKSLLDGSYGSGTATLKFQVGADANMTITLNISSLTAAAIGVSTLSVDTQDNANTALTGLDSAIDLVTNEAANVAVVDNRLEKAGDLVSNQIENSTTAISGVEDTDIAEEAIKLALTSILRQTSSAALAQANLYPQTVLSAILPG
ncbi:MAG: flagellin [Candidatus Hydrogenedentes bacterium CG07_land_8_20_14_0_80_42_17]|nr:MAG: flagellin [Candidatus Hydrogenedentes bacterium CG07_land_8_20_14_0_80_42_17]